MSLCPRCKVAERVPKQSYCADCKRYKDRVRKRRARGKSGDGRAISPAPVLRDPELKYCRGCGRALVRSLFYRDKSTKDGYSSRCKQCNNDSNRIWKQENKQRINARRRRYYRKHAALMRAKAIERKTRRKSAYIRRLLEGVRE